MVYLLRLIKLMSSIINFLLVVCTQYSVEITPNKASILSKVRFTNWLWLWNIYMY
jgi:hypothetical protein